MKINLDGPFVPETKAASVDAVLCDHLGNALAVMANALNTSVDAEEAEARACLEGIRLGASQL